MGIKELERSHKSTDKSGQRMVQLVCDKASYQRRIWALSWPQHQGAVIG